MKTFHKFCQGLLRSLLDFGQVNASLPLLATSDEMGGKPIGQVLETRNTFGGQAVEPGLCYPFHNVRNVVHILNVHLSLVHLKMLFWAHGPVIQFHDRHLVFPKSGSIDYLYAERREEGD